jgi:hypothetical protein
MTPEIEQALEDFIKEIELLVEQFGEEEVEEALALLLPGFEEFSDESAGETQYRQDIENRMMDEGLGRFGTAVADKLSKWGKKILPKRGGKAARTGAGTAGGGLAGLAAGGAAGLGGAIIGKEWDQDVNIAAITTDDSLSVDPGPDLIKLLTQNSEAIDKLTQVLTQTQQELAKKLSDLDKSVDYMATGEDESVDQVDIRQDLGLSKRKSKKPAEKDKEKKAKELEKGRQAAASPTPPRP